MVGFRTCLSRACGMVICIRSLYKRTEGQLLKCIYVIIIITTIKTSLLFFNMYVQVKEKQHDDGSSKGILSFLCSQTHLKNNKSLAAASVFVQLATRWE